MSTIESISLIGSGNVAFHLGKAFKGLVQIDTIYSRNERTGNELANELSARYSSDLSSAVDSDLVLICVNDDEINTIIKKLPAEQRVAYTSGSVGIQQLEKRNNLGVFYPLQTFSKDRAVDIFEVPFFIEGTNEVFAQQLFDLAWKLSRKVSFAHSEDRKNLHIAAVMVNNFVNHIATLSKEFIEDKGLDWNHLKPLILETAMKLQDVNPRDAQTGPASRGDEKTIASHLSILDGNTKHVYALLSDSIKNSLKE